MENITVEVNVKNTPHTVEDIGRKNQYECPNCKESNIFSYDNYCSNCGCELYWSDCDVDVDREYWICDDDSW